MSVDRSVISASRPFSETLILGLLVLVCISTGWWLFGFPALVSDVLGYAKWSHNLVEQAGGWFLPGYPLLIAATRTLTLGLIPDLPLMVGISFIVWVAGLIFVVRILKEKAPEALEIGVLLYGLFPLIGITHIAHPLSDTLAHTLFIGSFYFALKERKWAFVATTAMGLMVHVVLWPFFLLLSIVLLVQRRLTIWQVLVSGTPLALYYIAMAQKSADWLWFFRKHYEVNFKSSATVPLFNAVIEPLRIGSIVQLGKAMLVLSVIGVVVWLTLVSWRRRDWLAATTAFPLLFFAATVNAHEAFITVRYSRFLVIPFCLWIAGNAKWRAMLTSRSAVRATTLFLVVTQFAWSVYTVKFYWNYFWDPW